MEIKEKVLGILNEIKPTKDLSAVTDIMEGGYIDSFELMSLIMALNETFGVEISLDDMTLENFNSADAIVALVERLKG